MFAGRIRFNSHFLGSDILPNTCNVSILGPRLQGDVMTLLCPMSVLACWSQQCPLTLHQCLSEAGHDLHEAICKLQRL